MPSDAFNKAAEDAKNLKVKPNNDEMLKLYALFKQATTGDCDTAKPGMFDMTGKAKWSAWDALKGKSSADAESEYVEFVNSLVAKYGLN